jgi:membrane-bound serine protease (ClpP class)
VKVKTDLRQRGGMGLPTALLLGALLVLALGTPPAAATILSTEISGVITPATAEELEGLLETARARNAEALLLLLNTPGGSADATERMLTALERSTVPVVAYVPPGSRAFSAGAFLLLGSHVAAMAEGTATGAATPVAFSSEGVSAVEKKVVNAFAARMRGLAELRGRNATAAEAFVSEGSSLTAREALGRGLVDFVASDGAALLKVLDGRTVRAGGQNATLRTEGVAVEHHAPGLRARALAVLGDPQVASLLLMLGILALIFGLSNPGGIFPEVGGAIAILLALYGLGVVGASGASVLLLVVGVALLVAEIFIAGTHGALLAGGLISITLGLLFIPRAPGAAPGPTGFFASPEWWHTFLWTTVAATALVGAFFGFALTRALQLRRKRATTGEEELLGAEAEAATPLEPEGQVKLHGELWQARLQEGQRHAAAGERVVVEGRKGLTLLVRRK